jgi:leucyl-tRNA synthetase
LHLLYSRFVWMALQDWGFIPKSTPGSKNIPPRGVNWDEPFPFLYGHGLIIKDGFKMSKSRGNIVNPDEYLDKFGADTLRMYLMFIGPYDQGGDFKDTGMVGMKRFLNRVEKLCQDPKKVRPFKAKRSDLNMLRHKTIKKLTEAMSKFKFNVGIANIMEYVNGLEAYSKPGLSAGVDLDSIKTLILLLAPFAPYTSEELWFRLKAENPRRMTSGSKFSVHQQPYPKFDEKLATHSTQCMVVQINGKLRGRLELDQETAGDKAKILELAKPYLKGKKLIKEIFISGKLVNLVVK